MKEICFKDNSLHNLKGGTFNQREIKILDVKKLDFKKLSLLTNELNSKLTDKEFVKNNLYFFGENYEHNTDDCLLKVLGWNDENYLVETGNLVGYVATKDFKINVSSRFGDKFLMYLILYSEGVLEIEELGTAGNNGVYEWVLIFLWKKALQNAYRLGIPKQYISKQEKLHTIRGNIDILNYALNNGRSAKTLCRYHEYDYNNPVTQLIATTFSKIERKDMIEDCILLKNTFENCVEGKNVSLEKCLSTKEITNPYYTDYNKVIELSKSILRKRYGDITNTDNISSAFLFDMSMLFEYFIRKVLLKNGFKLFNKNNHSMTISRGLGKNNDRNLYPDIIIDRGEQEIEVYDVKYKNFDKKYGIKREDLFQLHTYVSYLSNYYTVTRCGIIYPQIGDEYEDNTNGIIEHPKYLAGIQLSVLFFNIPRDSEDFIKEMEKNSNKFIEKFKLETDTLK